MVNLTGIKFLKTGFGFDRADRSVRNGFCREKERRDRWH